MSDYRRVRALLAFEEFDRLSVPDTMWRVVAEMQGPNRTVNIVSYFPSEQAYREYAARLKNGVIVDARRYEHKQ